MLDVTEIIISRGFCLIKVIREEMGEVISEELYSGDCDASGLEPGNSTEAKYDYIADVHIIKGNKIALADRFNYRLRMLDIATSLVDQGISFGYVEVNSICDHPTNPNLLLIMMEHGLLKYNLQHATHEFLTGSTESDLIDGNLVTARFKTPYHMQFFNRNNAIITSSNGLRYLTYFSNKTGTITTICDTRIEQSLGTKNLEGTFDECRITACRAIFYDGERIFFSKVGRLKYIGTNPGMAAGKQDTMQHNAAQCSTMQHNAA